MRKTVFFHFFFIVILAFSCKSQDTKNNLVFEKFKAKKKELNIPTPPNTAVKVDELIKKFNYNNDDLTDFIQKILDENTEVIFPNQIIEVNTKGLKLRSGHRIWFQEKSAIKIKPNNLKRYIILNINDAQNVKVYNPRIIGDRYEHLDSKGEWGFGMRVSASEDIEIYNAHISDTWGDGISLAREKNKCNHNLIVKNIYVEKARRNGITVGCGEKILVENVYIFEVSGTNPQAGIDVEPDNNNDQLINVKLKNIFTQNCIGAGIIVSLKGLIGEKQKTVSIQIENHSDVGSQHGFALGSSASKTVKDGHAVKGKIQLKNSNYLDNRSRAIEIYKSPYNDIELDIVNPILKKLDKPDTSSTKAYQEKINKYYKN